ncbi:hypothetical protein AG0111_0g5192 [Alternaria gaisen]|uniref:Uncharacterized protein n=1 Tax=Alternaria gaisen TaxID=167740 RepID=A0ACB6FQA6_9PLEO|nr:hypothetical protein AG0111_0g5192 [Alternaria gaisen]
MNDYCLAAGSIGAEKVQRNHQRQRRQIGDLLSSIVGDVSSVLSSNGVAVPTAIIESVAGSVVNALPTPANPTSIAAEITATSATEDASSTASSTAQTSTGASSTRNEASSTASQGSTSSSSAAAASSPSSNSSSGPSTGLIAGVVVGGVAALALIGIFILLLLRHRKRKSRTAAMNDKEASAAASSSSDHSPPTQGAYARVPQQNAYPTTTTLPTQTDSSSTQPTTMMSPVSPITPGGQAPWASTSTFGGATATGAGAGAATAAAGHALHSSAPAPRYSDEKPPQRHQYIDSKIPESNEMPTNANVWEIDGREMPPPSELDAGKRDGLSLGNIGSNAQAQGQTQQQECVAYRPPSVGNGQSNWSGQNGEFSGNRQVGQAI